MNKKERIKLVGKILDEYFPAPQVPLHHVDPFTLLVAVMLSASAQDARVNEVTKTLFKLAPTPQKMAAIDLGRLEKLLVPIGLYRAKSKNLKKCAQILVEKYHGKVPANMKDLESLPGVGHKTASVVMAQAFCIPAFPVDTHVFRLARRWKLSTAKTRKYVEEDLKRLFAKKEWIKRHLQMILFGRKFCPARGHSLGGCPICSRLFQPDPIS